MTRVLLVWAGGSMSSFIAQDLALLRRHHEVTPFHWTGKAGALALLRAVRGHDVALSWFASHHAAVAAWAARLAGRRSVVIVGGVEVAPPELFGQRWRGRDRWAVRTALDRSDLVLAVSQGTADEARALRSPRARGELRVLPNGIDTQRFRPGGAKEDLVLTVSVLDEATIARKRLDLFVAAARLVPEARWVLAGSGPAADRLGAAAPANLELPGRVSDDALLALYQRSKVYVQASVHESFGMANAEAMACGAVPVVARARGGLPEVVGDAGLYLPEPPTAEALAAAVRQALRSELGPEARARIEGHYGMMQREQGLSRAVEDAAQR